MIKEKLFNATKLPILSKGLDAYALRHRAISDNVANVETPGYQRRKVEFEAKLQGAIGEDTLVKTNSRHLGHGGMKVKNVNPEMKLDQEASDINDLNNVDIDREMGEMARNHLQFSFASKIASSSFDLIKFSIRGM